MKTRAGGGFAAIAYSLAKALEVGPARLWAKMTARNACKTCAVGMGGQRGGMVNEAGRFPEVCKKSLQAQVADMKGAIAPSFFERHSIENLERLTPKEAEDAGRLAFPLIIEARASHARPATWEEALALAASALKQAAPPAVAFYSSGRSSNEAAFLLQSFARVYGTNHVMNCSFYCHQASGVALKMSIGTGTATVTLDDLDLADLVLVCGANPASNHPRLMTMLADLRARGGEVIVVNPLRESGLVRFHVPSKPHSLLFGSEIASLYVQPLAGGDAALFLGVLKALDERGLLNRPFMDAHASGSAEAIKTARDTTWGRIVEQSGVSRDEMVDLAVRIAKSKRAVFCWAMGLTHHTTGVDNVLALVNIAIATGHLGRPGAGLLPLRGHSNVQGVGSVGFTPELMDGVRLALETAYGKPFPQSPGLDTHAMIQAAAQGRIAVLVALGGNLWGSNPDLDFAEKAMKQIMTTVYLSTKLNPGHFRGRGKTTVILPVLARDEEPQATTQESMFNYVRLSEGGSADAAGQMRAESAVICDLAGRVLGDSPVDWSRLTSHREVRRLIADVLPGWQELARIDEGGREFTIGGRIFHQPHFATADGRARMHATEVVPFHHQGLRLITLRSEGQFNTIVYENEDLYRGIPHRHCLLVSAGDAARLGIASGERVSVRGEAGRMSGVEVVVGDIRPGCVAMFYPEANVLIKGRPDPRSQTPAFKSAPVWIERD